MNQSSSSYTFLSNLVAWEKIRIFVAPVLISVFLTIAIVLIDNTEDALYQLVDSLPLVLSILTGFLASILVVSLSNNRIFRIMRENNNSDGTKHYTLFVSGLFFNLWINIISLIITISAGLFRTAICACIPASALTILILLSLLLLSITLFAKNMNRLFLVIHYEDR